MWEENIYIDTRKFKKPVPMRDSIVSNTTFIKGKPTRAKVSDKMKYTYVRMYILENALDTHTLRYTGYPIIIAPPIVCR